MREGWIKLHRQILDHWIWKDDQKAKAWLVILLEVNHGKRKVLLGNQVVEVERGQSIQSLDSWAHSFGRKWNKSGVRRFFKTLEEDGMIKTENIKKTTRLTVCNYENYQEVRNGDETVVNHNRNVVETEQEQERHESELQKASNNNAKNDKELKNEEKERNGGEGGSRDPLHPDYERFKRFEQLISQYPSIRTMDEQLNVSQYSKLVSGFGLALMEAELPKFARSDKATRRKSFFRTFRNWLDKLSKHPVHERCKDRFIEFYREESEGEEMVWTSTDTTALELLLGKLEASFTIKNSSQPSEEELFNSFQTLLKKLPGFYRKNALSIPTIKNKYNEIIAAIKTGTSQGTGTGRRSTEGDTGERKDFH